MRGDLIEVFKIITREDNNGNCNLVLHKSKGLATRWNRYKLYQKLLIMTLENIFLLTELLHSGTVCLIMLCHLPPLTRLKID